MFSCGWFPPDRLSAFGAIGAAGGWSLYCVDGCPTYAYNCYGRDLTTVRSEVRLAGVK